MRSSKFSIELSTELKIFIKLILLWAAPLVNVWRASLNKYNNVLLHYEPDIGVMYQCSISRLLSDHHESYTLPFEALLSFDRIHIMLGAIISRLFLT